MSSWQYFDFWSDAQANRRKRERRQAAALQIDPRIPFAALLTVYAILGCTLLRFNRTPLQMLVTAASTCALDMLFAWVLRREKLVPLSAYISGLSLALLLNYSHDSYVLFLPVFLTVASKYVLTFEGRHVLNPSMFGVSASLLLGGDLIGTAPAYQWGGTWAMSAFLVAAALFLFVFRVGRTWLIVSFLGFYVIQILIRAWLMRWYLPPESLVLGTLTSAPFFLFVFYMITDPKTSPSRPRDQVILAFALTVVDLAYHTRGSLYTFFYAALTVGLARFVWLHLRGARTSRPREALPGVLFVLGFGAVMYGTYAFAIRPNVAPPPLTFSLEKIDPRASGVAPRMDGSIIGETDPRVQHVAKWLLSAGDAASAGDFDGDGLLDLFLCGPFKAREDRAILYRNLGGLRFERVRVPALEAIDAKRHGVISSGTFVDHDNDGDQDLLITVGYGRSLLLRNDAGMFADATAASGVADYTISIAANFLDFDNDGRLDLFVANALNPWLEQYRPPRPLSIFALQQPEHEGDRRMLPFMHASWDDARNGG
ncbi:MAG TPA: FG-GAP-like repeat-containing protein, partial [Thermoanaerobaculia bacterium]|nr:FG-GAP-like repeat-containing protein [Thermoanaerobaculia bacterium]